MKIVGVTSVVAFVASAAEAYNMAEGKALVGTICARCHALDLTGKSSHADALPTRWGILDSVGHLSDLGSNARAACWKILRRKWGRTWQSKVPVYEDSWWA